MLHRLGPKLILSLTVLIVVISCIAGFLNFRTQKQLLIQTMVIGADQLSRSITSATWHAMADDHREAAYEIMQAIADKYGVDRIRGFNGDGQLRYSTDPQDPRNVAHEEVCKACHTGGGVSENPTPK